MLLTILAVGATTTPEISRLIDAYMTRLRRYTPVELLVIPDVRAAASLSQPERKEREGQAILAALRPSDRVVLLDERGAEMTSPQFAEELNRRMAQGLKRMVLVIGGPYGFSQAVYDRADAKMALSRMTFTHEMVRLFIVEQVYRAHTILRNDPYHH